MTDINSKAAEPAETAAKTADKPLKSSRAASEGRGEMRYIELLFFAYRDFISDPDAALIDYGFGRAHHRIMHFVSRQPGIRVADLLDILKITKQSLGRVLKQLIDSGFIEQRPGPQDRRQRLLYPTAAGRALTTRLLDLQMARVAGALKSLSPTEAAGAERFLRQMVDESEREKVARLIKRGS
jgi:DNA-binding MarR family transcriptional regulator